MKQRRAALIVSAGLAALIAVSIASAQVVDRVRIADAGRTLTAGLPPGVFLLLVSPPGYTRASAGSTEGSWVGPEYRATGKPDLRGRTTIQWTVRFNNQAKNSEDAALGAVERGWRETLRGGISVPHLIGRRDIGTLDGDFVLTAGSGAADASYEAAMAFPIAPRLFAVVNFFLTTPSGTSAAPYGEYVVGESVRAGTWNRGQAFRAMAGIRIQGNLPPTRMSVRGTARLVSGSVADAFRHPVVGARLTLERLTGRAWRKVTSTKTDERGSFRVRVGRRAQYRAVATLGTASIRSVAVTAGTS